MSAIYELSFRQVVAVAASDAPTPGGGSIAALAGALGTAMTAMVGNLTYGKPKFKDVEPEVQEITGAAYFIINRLEKLVGEDMAAFAKFMDAYRLPKNTDEEKAKREEQIQKGLKLATETPVAIGRALLEALELTEKLSKIGNTMAISDAGVAAYLCEAALNGVLLTADINIPQIKDAEYVKNITAEKEQLMAKAKELRDKALVVVQERMK